MIDYDSPYIRHLIKMSTPQERWYCVPGTYIIVSNTGRAISAYRCVRSPYSLPIELKLRYDQHGRKYIYLRNKNSYTRLYLDEGMAKGELIEVTEERKRQWEKEFRDEEKEREIRLRSEAHKLAEWMLGSQNHLDYWHYYKVFRSAILWGGQNA